MERRNPLLMARAGWRQRQWPVKKHVAHISSYAAVQCAFIKKCVTRNGYEGSLAEAVACKK